MELNTEIWPLVSLVHRKNNINPTPEYQRYAVWNSKQQQLLMDSIYRGMDIPKLYLRKTASGSEFQFEAVDGQQRMRAVWDFYNNEFALSKEFTPELAGKKYDDLEMDQKQVFDIFQFSLVVIRDSTDAEIREMFCRLQNGKALNAAEKRNAMVSDMRDFCAGLAEHSFFQSVRFKNTRMQHHQVAGQTVCIELAGGPTNVKAANVTKLYEAYTTFNSDSAAAKRIRKIYDFLYECFPEPIPELKVAMVVSCFTLVSELLKHYSLTGRSDAFREFVVDFEHKRRTRKDDNEFVTYDRNLARSSDGEEAIEYRNRMLLREFHAFVPDLIPIDSQRGFDESQRITIYRRDGGKCKYCGTDVAWDDFHADHVVAHSKGGPTTVDNGWLSCSACNTSKGSKSADSDS